MDNDTKSIAGATSVVYHTTMWILVIAGLLGNIVVMVWRCSRKESRQSLLSMLIISLAFADIVYCCHYLLEEVMLVNKVFASDQANVTIHVTSLDERLCLSVLFFASVSTNAIMLTTVAIALATFFSFHLHRHGNLIITWFLVISWLYCLAFGGVVVWRVRPSYQAMTKPTLDVNTFSLIVVYRCLDTSSDARQWNTFPIIGTTLNAMGSIVVAVIYIHIWCTVRKHAFTHSRNQEITHFRIRLTIISGLNVLCWWPACIMVWFASASKRSVFNGTLSPVAPEPLFVITAAVSVANPIIYTIASTRFLTVARRACSSVFCWRRKEERLHLPLPAGEHTAYGNADGSASFCCRFCPCQQPRDTGVVVHVFHPESMTENTEDASLFSESE